MAKLKKKKKDGYILVQCEHPEAVKGWIPEHRLVVENHIGRFLKKGEIIHHIDEDKLNNKIDNLMIFKSNAEHMTFHNKVRRGMTNPIRKQIETRWEKEREEQEESHG